MTSTPSEATVTEGENSWTTPVIISLERKREHQLIISKPGWKTQTVQVHCAISAMPVANILIPFGLVGWGIDVGSGAQWNLTPDKIDVKLRQCSLFENMFFHLNFARPPCKNK